MKTYKDFEIIQTEGSDRFDLYRNVMSPVKNKQTGVIEDKLVNRLIGYALTESRVIELISSIHSYELSGSSFTEYLKKKAEFYNELVKELSE
jgi:hypothetical protein